MTVIVTDTGFRKNTWEHGYHRFRELPTPLPRHLAVDFPSDLDPELLNTYLGRIELIRVEFSDFANGQGFTIARRLRLMEFQGHLRAKGHIIADQYAMARRCGFDDVEIDTTLAMRQPQDQWVFRSNWQDHNYQARLGGRLALKTSI